MKILCVCLIGMILDWIFGDPVWLYHPVRMIGNMISFLEKRLRKENDKKNMTAGGVLWIIVAILCGTEGGAEYPSVDLLFLRVVLVLSDLCGKISE